MKYPSGSLGEAWAKWMVEKGHAFLEDGHFYITLSKSNNGRCGMENLDKQMLVGYILEFFMSKQYLPTVAYSDRWDIGIYQRDDAGKLIAIADSMAEELPEALDKLLREVRV